MLFLRATTLEWQLGNLFLQLNLKSEFTPSDGNYVWEWWYQFQVGDNISVTPALFYLSRPLGQLTPTDNTFTQLGGLLKTTFKF